MFQSTVLNSLINGLDPIHGKSVQLRPGQVFQGTITHLYPGQLAQLKLGPLTLTAKLEAQLEKGNKYFFQVLKGDGLPQLKVLQSQPFSSMDRGSSSPLQSLMQQLAIPPGGEAEVILQRYIKESVPFLKNDIREAVMLMEQSRMPLEDTLKTILQIHSKGLPKTVDVFNSIATLQSSTSIGEGIGQLLKGINDYGLHQSFPKLVEVLRAYEQPISQNALLNNGQPPYSFLKQIISQLGLQYEFNLNKSNDIQQLNQSTQDLKPLLMSFLENVPERLVSVREQAEFLLHRLTAYQLLSSDSHDLLHRTLVQIPVYFDQKYRDVTIQWEGKQQADGTISEEHCRILFYLNMTHLKDVAVDLQIQNRIVSIKIYNENPKPHLIINSLFPSIKEKLEEMDYQLSTINWYHPNEGNRKLIKSEGSYGSQGISYQGVDIRI
ncbi:hypothetical protein [Evansella cellulosilytica]|uniref:Flagellar hook-length control protein FliK n=1 Tax=Evansella cellulosilytica (strain ATCC 21833 / DSM 2522 / FERM P-1141 / JCM 9156 / N-4) TaxID=649639 RepID=E6TSY3_EVAC2|nr:hypothetical protein [Evansella cellulosilytica]ADU30775.1 hypothetical protein Bcell_2518 [Evansella cellulosilytica DSM 2522]